MDIAPYELRQLRFRCYELARHDDVIIEGNIEAARLIEAYITGSAGSIEEAERQAEARGSEQLIESLTKSAYAKSGTP